MHNDLFDEIFNCQDITKFSSSIVQILPWKGYSMSRFFVCEVQQVLFLVKMCFYRKVESEIYGGKSKALSQTETEINILQLLKRKIIYANVSPCILEIIYHKTCKTRKLTPTIRGCEDLLLQKKDPTVSDEVEKILCRYQDLVKNDLAYEKCSFLIMERCDISLSKFLERSINNPVNQAILKSIIFQIIYTVVAVRKLYPSFLHNDLHTDNIMLKIDHKYKFSAASPKFLLYYLNGKEYAIPYFGIIPKIIDFGFSVIKEEGIVSNFTEDKIQMHFRSGHDILTLFHHIYHTTGMHNPEAISPVNKILQALDPNQAYIHNQSDYVKKIMKQVPSCEAMLENKIFDEYKEYRITAGQVQATYGQ